MKQIFKSTAVILVGLALLAFGIVSLVGCGGSSDGGSAGATVFSTSGTGDATYGMGSQTTTTFQTASTWHIETTCTALNTASALSLSVLIYPEGATLDAHSYIDGIVQSKAGTQTKTIKQSGGFYLVIMATNVKDWTVTVTQ